jgi:hypothetical protein
VTTGVRSLVRVQRFKGGYRLHEFPDKRRWIEDFG